jgi:hypothetical protein
MFISALFPKSLEVLGGESKRLKEKLENNIKRKLKETGVIMEKEWN